MTDAVRLEDVTKKYGEVTALSEVTMSVSEGDMFALLGNNGAGKTTAIDIITGQIRADSGEVSVLGEDPLKNPVSVRSKLGILPEREQPPDDLTPREYFEFIQDLRGIPEDDVERRVIEWSSKLDFAGELDSYCSDLSRGEQQMVMITQAFLSNPDLIIIDEPLVNLDPQRQERVKEALLQYRNRGNTVILSTHRLSFAEDIASTVGIIHEGRMQEVVKVDELREEGKSLESYFADKTIPIPSAMKQPK